MSRSAAIPSIAGGFHQHRAWHSCDSCQALQHCIAERGVDLSAVQTVDKPTRDVLVVYDSDGDRQFVGFGGPNDSFADCFISAEQLPLEILKSCAALVTGTLGLAFPSTAAAMHRAVETARTGSAVVSVSSTKPLAAQTLQSVQQLDASPLSAAGRKGCFYWPACICTILSRRPASCSKGPSL